MITLTAMPGLTVDVHGRALLEVPFVFQCPPLDSHRVQHAFTFGNYDTIEDGQFTRRGSRQLDTWQFDTLAMYLGNADPTTEDSNSQKPSWVPFPTMDGPNYQPPQWYVDQLKLVHDAGAPFRYRAAFLNAPEGTVHRTPAILTGFAENHRGGEGDAIYMEAVTFSEWRNPSVTSNGAPVRSPKQLPSSVTLRRNDLGTTTGAYTSAGQRVPASGNVTLGALAKYFYGDPSIWRVIATANGIKSPTANSALTKLGPFTSKSHNMVAIPAPEGYGQLGPDLSPQA